MVTDDRFQNQPGRYHPDPDPDPDPDPHDNSIYLSRNTRCCFLFPSWWQRIRHDDVWWVRAILKLRQWSEIVAGPRWKTFLRRFNRRHGGGFCGGDRDRHGHWHGQGQFQYDALSYALNFDEGPVVVEDGDGDVDEDRVYGGFRSFSTRYAAAPSWNKKTIAGGGGGGGGDTEADRLVA